MTTSSTPYTSKTSSPFSRNTTTPFPKLTPWHLPLTLNCPFTAPDTSITSTPTQTSFPSPGQTLPHHLPQPPLLPTLPSHCPPADLTTTAHLPTCPKLPCPGHLEHLAEVTCHMDTGTSSTPKPLHCPTTTPCHWLQNTDLSTAHLLHLLPALAPGNPDQGLPCAPLPLDNHQGPTTPTRKMSLPEKGSMTCQIQLNLPYELPRPPSRGYKPDWN